jgi:RNA polymerase sigma-70 factor (ECF subfamily)
VDAAGCYVPLNEQAVGEWDHVMIDRAEGLLQRAGGMGRPGRFQIEAAIQSAHAQRRVTGVVAWEVVATLYELLMSFTEALGARLGHAIAVGQAFGAEKGWAVLEVLPKERLTDHQPYWAARAHLLAQMGRREEAKAAYERAIGLCDDAAVRGYLMGRRNAD